jgi:hypothetical protein
LLNLLHIEHSTAKHARLLASSIDQVVRCYFDCDKMIGNRSNEK